MSVIEDAISKIEDWKGRNVSFEPLLGGLTNPNYKVNVDGIPFFVRVPGESTELLAVDRKNEYTNSKAAAEAGVGPKVLYYLPEFKVMVLEFIEGETMSKEALNAPGMPTRMAQAIKQLHGGPRFLTDFNMFRITEYYLKLCNERNIPIPDGYLDRMPTIEQIEEAMSDNPLPTVPCNNDLLAENYIDDGKSLRLIDYEYSGNNDPCFELGNTCQEMEFDETQIQEVCAAYFGSVSASKIARMKLNMVMSDVGWGLWAAIQEKISTIEYDFWGWAIERWGRAEEKMDSAEFSTWLLEVQS
ncbi:MAG: phosphotransferase family protein [Anaerolineales bacterium]|uniref:Phosphotransferase family protein n=1 Tax=Candidatus Desulfolinea nitratireducens TaxID=2841698 RepID=A0A8J6NQD5_9CHLR|nr:phosphotransferase family protein [Candidatus Desulfolinea nitratireducens]MBL6961358.1 phosphotransferase family protein [Anaerolineales bacterium]